MKKLSKEEMNAIKGGSQRARGEEEEGDIHYFDDEAVAL